jgi:hypothetical protein
MRMIIVIVTMLLAVITLTAVAKASFVSQTSVRNMIVK